MHANDKTRTGERWLPWLMFLGIAAVYLSFPTKNYFFDGIDFAHTIETTSELSASLTHPNHLIYNLVGWFFYRCFRGLGIEVRAVTALQILNSILSVASAYVLFAILKSILRSRYLSYALTLLFAFSATWWKFSTDADAYVPAVLFLLISFYFCLPSNRPRPFIVALAYATTLCFHQIAIVFFPVLVIAVLLQDLGLQRRGQIINGVAFATTATAVTLGAYALSFFLLTRTFHPRDFVRWTTSYAPDDSFGFHALANLGFTVRGHFRLFFGGRLNASQGLVNPFIVVLSVALILVLLLFAFQIIRHLKKPSFNWLSELRQDPYRRTVALLCLLWISVYLVFLYFILAHHTFYRLFYLPAIIILLGLALDASKTSDGRHKYRLALFVAVLFISNFIMLIFPYAQVQKYPPLALALQLNQAWPPGTIIYYASANSDNSLVRYWNPTTIWKHLEAATPPELDASAAHVWLETTAINKLSSTADGAAWLTEHTAAGAGYSLVTKAYDIRFVEVRPDRLISGRLDTRH